MARVLVGVAASAVVTWALCPLVIRRLRDRQVLDVPGERSSHSVPTPRGGGLAPALGATCGLLVVLGRDERALAGLAVAAVGFGSVGLAEDLIGVGPARRLALQFAVAILALALLLDEVTLSPLGLLAVAVALFWLPAFVNSFNFMDGIDGISSVQVILAGAAWAGTGARRSDDVLVAGGAIVAAAALAFVPFNFPTARVFLGDVGSYFFGGWLAAMVVLGLGRGHPPELLLAPVLLYLCDTSTTLARRLLRGEPVTAPHRQHAYQRLLQHGWSHGKTTGVVGLFVLACTGLGLVAGAGPPRAGRLAADAGLVALLGAYLLLPSLIRTHAGTVPAGDSASRRPRRPRRQRDKRHAPWGRKCE